MHRDLKHMNIFLSKDLSVKIGDLGIAKIIYEKETSSENVGTPLFMAPELVRSEPYSKKIDVWALGCCLYNFSQLSHPFKGDNQQTLYQNILH